MKSISRKLLVVILFISMISLGCINENKNQAENTSAKDTTAVNKHIVLENTAAQLTIAQHGGSYIGFNLKGQPLNPFSWTLTNDQMPENNKQGAVFQGHFLCLGRWGSPSEGEMAAGVPHNGEPSNNLWEILQQDSLSIAMKAEAPMDGLIISRKVSMSATDAVFQVSEEVKNDLSIGRIYNIVQHGTIGPPFLQPSTIINSNAGPGFLQALSYPDPHRFAFTWPTGYADSLKTPIDLTSSSTTTNYVATHIFNKESEFGWITAATPDKELLMGYIWKTSEYPWLNVWHHMENGKPHAKGLEFGTTGIGKSYKELLEVDTRFYNHNSYDYIDAGETQSKSFTCFLLKIPADFNGVDRVIIENGEVVVHEKDAVRAYRLAL